MNVSRVASVYRVFSPPTLLHNPQTPQLQTKKKMASLAVTLPDRSIAPAPNHLPVKGKTTPVPHASYTSSLQTHAAQSLTHDDGNAEPTSNPANAADTSAATFVPPPLEHPRTTAARSRRRSVRSESDDADDSDTDTDSDAGSDAESGAGSDAKGKATAASAASPPPPPRSSAAKELPHAPPMPSTPATSTPANAAPAIASPSTTTNIYFKVARILLYVIIALLVGYLAYWVATNVFASDDDATTETSSTSSWWTMPSLAAATMSAKLLSSSSPSQETTTTDDLPTNEPNEAHESGESDESSRVAAAAADNTPATAAATTSSYATPSFVPSFGDLFGWNRGATTTAPAAVPSSETPPHAETDVPTVVSPPAGTVTATTAQGDRGDAMRAELSDSSAAALLDMMAKVGGQ